MPTLEEVIARVESEGYTAYFPCTSLPCVWAEESMGTETPVAALQAARTHGLPDIAVKKILYFAFVPCVDFQGMPSDTALYASSYEESQDHRAQSEIYCRRYDEVLADFLERVAPLHTNNLPPHIMFRRANIFKFAHFVQCSTEASIATFPGHFKISLRCREGFPSKWFDALAIDLWCTASSPSKQGSAFNFEARVWLLISSTVHRKPVAMYLVPGTDTKFKLSWSPGSHMTAHGLDVRSLVAVAENGSFEGCLEGIPKGSVDIEFSLTAMSVADSGLIFPAWKSTKL
eukprot:TRINITY_DN10213_c0_g1_i1.p1 TRINITY_DN10213_c0_g1~~TRINITY_DN10213_c0_g1_i1.p1  ORF type:complete len:288 (+),score=14.68 TRINITY_DN10213_c0_g1_i1:124-987(+)